MWDVNNVTIDTQHLYLSSYIYVFYTAKEDAQLWYHKSKTIPYE